jgi:hypothetical protein
MKLYLNFVSPNYGKIEISEPIGFDAFSFKIKQGKDRFGRDKNIGAEQIDLEFIQGYFEHTDTTRTQKNGVVINNLTMCFDEIIEAISENGSEAKIEFIIEQNGNEFINGLLDIPQSTTDNISYFRCSVVQDTQKALIERKKDIKADVFSSIDTFGEVQIPLEKTKILLKAKPVVQVSEWKSDNPVLSQTSVPGFYTNPIDFFNPFIVLTKYNIEDSLIPFDKNSDNETANSKNKSWRNFKYLKANTDLSNLVLEIKGNCEIERINNPPIAEEMSIALYYSVFYDQNLPTGLPGAGNLNLIGGFIRLLEDEYTNSYFYDLKVDLPNLAIGESLYLYFAHASSNNGNDIIKTVFSADSYIKVLATSTSVNSVIYGVPYFDFLKQGIKSISKLDLEANDIELGDFKNQFVFNGNLIRQIDDKPLHFVFKDEMNDLKEFNGDYQILNDKVQILQYPDFYPNIEIGAFNISPDNSVFERKFNDRFKDFSLEFNYKNFEDDKDEKNTIDSVHTESQWQHANEQVDNTPEVSINHIRDPFLIETMRKSALKDSTALSTDDKIVLLDCIQIPEGTTGSVTAVLTMRVLFEGTRLEILGTSAINWMLLGFKNGDEINISFGKNVGSYFVLQHSSTLLELTFISGVCDFSGDALITIEYPLTDVQWTNRTNEGFGLIEGVANPQNFSNLKYTIKRNLMRDSWSSYLATINKDVSNGVIRNTYFKNNGGLISQFEGGKILTEKDNFLVSELSEKILNKHEIKTKIGIGFDEAKQLIEDIASVKGFIRVFDPNNKMYKIHPTMLDMIWRDGIMEVVGEERNESDIVTIEISGNVIIINEVGYIIKMEDDIEWFRFTGDYLQLFDDRSRPLINPTKFDKISLNGIVYNSVLELAIALN